MRLKGTVIGDKADKTVVVSIERRTQHPLYRKRITRRRKYSAHDEKNLCKTGDVVEIIMSRPFSKTKRWAVTRILQSPDRSLSGETATKETPS